MIYSNDKITFVTYGETTVLEATIYNFTLKDVNYFTDVKGGKFE